MPVERIALPAGQTKEKVIRSLADFAAADAEHDFSSSRAGGNLFARIFEKYKLIGTPVDPSPATLTEFQILNKFLSFIPGGTPAAGEPTAFQNKFLKEDTTWVFKRWDGDNEEYTLKVKKIATKGGGDSRDYTMTAEELYTWLNVKGSVAFTIDAVSVPFYERFEQAGASEKTLYYVNTREGINDAAGKVILNTKEGTKVKVVNIEDTEDSVISYPTVNPSTGRAIDANFAAAGPNELFFSNFNLQVSPVNRSGKVESVNLSISSKDFSKQITVLKGKKEDAHPNAVATLSTLILSILKAILKAGDSGSADRTKYHSYLQQKRSGDWLQVLACLDTGRFKSLPAGSRIIMATLDKICLAYALAMGVDSLFTYVKQGAGTTDYWLLYFYRGTPEEPKKVLAKELRQAKIELNPDTPLAANVPASSYRESLPVFNDRFDTILVLAKEALDNKIRDERPAGRRLEKKKVVENIQNVLIAALEYGIFYAQKEKYVEIDLEFLGDAAIRGVDAGRDLEEATKALSQYKASYSHLKSIFTKTPRAGAADVGSVFQAFLESLVSDRRSTFAEYKDYIKDLKVFDTLFERGNGGKHGLGIFSFLNTILDTATKQQLIGYLVEMQGIISGGLSATEKVRYSEFLATARLLTDTEGGAAVGGATGAVGGAATPEDRAVLLGIQNAGILSVIDSVHDTPALEEAAVIEAIQEIVADAEVAAAALRRSRRARGEAPAGGGSSENSTLRTLKEALEAHIEATRAEAVILKKRNGANTEKLEELLDQIDLEIEPLLNRIKALLTQDGGAGEEREGAIAGRVRRRGEEEGEEEEEETIAAVRITDFHACMSILAYKFGVKYEGHEEGIRAAFDRNLPERNDENPGAPAGGGSPKGHNPITTLYLALREVSFRLRSEGEDQDAYERIASFILDSIEIVKKMPESEQKSALNSLELYVLTSLEIPGAKLEVDQLKATLLKDYYGYTGSLPDQESPKEFEEIAKTVGANGKDRVGEILTTMRSLIEWIRTSEMALEEKVEYVMPSLVPSKKATRRISKPKALKASRGFTKRLSRSRPKSLEDPIPLVVGAA